jgi:hypothetical protein
MGLTFDGKPRGDSTCDLSLLDHWNDIADALTSAGIGLRCEKAYQAFLIIAETARILNHHPEYDPKPEAEKLAALALEHARRLAELKMDDTFEAMVTPVDKKKVN